MPQEVHFERRAYQDPLVPLIARRLLIPLWEKLKQGDKALVGNKGYRGHVFCSFLAMMLMKKLLSRLEASSKSLEWEEIKRDLMALQAARVAMPATLRR